MSIMIFFEENIKFQRFVDLLIFQDYLKIYDVDIKDDGRFPKRDVSAFFYNLEL